MHCNFYELTILFYTLAAPSDSPKLERFACLNAQHGHAVTQKRSLGRGECEVLQATAAGKWDIAHIPRTAVFKVYWWISFSLSLMTLMCGAGLYSQNQ